MCLPTLLIRPSHTQCVSFVQDSLLLSLFQGFTRQCSTSCLCMLTSQRTRKLWKGYQSMLYFLLPSDITPLAYTGNAAAGCHLSLHLQQNRLQLSSRGLLCRELQKGAQRAALPCPGRPLPGPLQGPCGAPARLAPLLDSKVMQLRTQAHHCTLKTTRSTFRLLQAGMELNPGNCIPSQACLVT